MSCTMGRDKGSPAPVLLASSMSVSGWDVSAQTMTSLRSATVATKSNVVSGFCPDVRAQLRSLEPRVHSSVRVRYQEM